MIKITLNIDGQEIDFAQDCVQNWAEITCAYKRSDFSGVVRSLASTFEFVGDAYYLLLDLWMKVELNAKASVTLHTQNDDFTYSPSFTCPLDFSSVKIKNGVFSVGCVDDDVAAKLKANKTTSYELKLGEDVERAGAFHYDRLEMMENVTYEFTQGDSDDDSSAITCEFQPTDSNGGLVWLGSVGSEIPIGGVMYYNDDQSDDAGCLLEVVSPESVEVKFEYSDVRDASFDGSDGTMSTFYIQRVDSEGNVLDEQYLCIQGGAASRPYLGEFTSSESLESTHPAAEMDGAKAPVAEIDGECWTIFYDGHQPNNVWINTHKSKDEVCRADGTSTDGTFTVNNGDKIRVIGRSSGTARFRLFESKLLLSWRARGKNVDIDCVTPSELCRGIVAKIDPDHFADVIISGHDGRAAKTVMLAGESVRGFDDAKFTTSFGEFCDWMAAVFGYTYRLGRVYDFPFTRVMRFRSFITTPISYDSVIHDADCPAAECRPSRIYYVVSLNMFVYSYGGYYYSRFQTAHLYGNSNPSNRALYDDVIYMCVNDSIVDESDDPTWSIYRGHKYDSRLYNYDGTTLVVWDGDIRKVGRSVQEIEFLHRSELFADDAPLIVIGDEVEADYSLDTSRIFATVEAGYSKQDYDNINGRDEFNFTATYSTGCQYTEKKLPLVSKYRADCYGIEFAVQQRGEQTSDSKTDKNVYFALCAGDGGDYYPDRSIPVSGTLNDSLVFNAAFSPMACVEANKGYLAAMSPGAMSLTFASADGNSDVEIDGRSITDEIHITGRLFTVGQVSFSAGDDVGVDVDAIYEVSSRGVKYRGYVDDVEIGYAKAKPFKFKLTVKSIEA